MQKYLKEKLESMLTTLKKAENLLLEQCKKNTIGQSIGTLLEDMQSCAISIGEAIESTEGPENMAVKYLEEYCELLWQCMMEESSGGRIRICRMLEEKRKNCRKYLKNNIAIRYEAVFFPYKASMWDSLESVWEAAVKDESCDAYVVPIPYYDRNPDGSFGKVNYEGDEFPEYVPITHYWKYDWTEHRPDVIFIHNPYDAMNHVTSIHPSYYSSELLKHTDLLVYIPYYITAGNVPEYHCLSPGVLYAHKVIVQSEQARQTYIRVISKEFGWSEKQAKQRIV